MNKKRREWSKTDGIFIYIRVKKRENRYVKKFSDSYRKNPPDNGLWILTDGSRFLRLFTLICMTVLIDPFSSQKYGPGSNIILISKKYVKRLEGRVQRGELQAPPPSCANRPSRRCMLVPADVDRHQLLTTSAKSHSCFSSENPKHTCAFLPC